MHIIFISERIIDTHIYVGMTEDRSSPDIKECGYITDGGAEITVDCWPNTVGRYVSLVRNAIGKQPALLQMCEVIVAGRPGIICCMLSLIRMIKFSLILPERPVEYQ